MTCAMLEERSFELLTSADAMWAIRKHSAMRIEAQRGASLVLFNETCRSGNEGGKQKVGGKARRERQNERAKHSGYCTLVGRSGESRGRIVAFRTSYTCSSYSNNQAISSWVDRVEKYIESRENKYRWTQYSLLIVISVCIGSSSGRFKICRVEAEERTSLACSTTLDQKRDRTRVRHPVEGSCFSDLRLVRDGASIYDVLKRNSSKNRSQQAY